VTARIADSAGVRIAYESFGQGPPVLLVQGIGYARWSWDPIVPALAERFRVLNFDNRGIGESDVPAPPYTARQLAEDAVAVLDAESVDRAHVVGASLGGMAAQELAAGFPERVDRLVLACTTPGGAGAMPMPGQTVALMQEAATLPPEVALRRFVENALAPHADRSLVEDLYQRRLANPPDPVGWQGQAAAGATFDGTRLEILAPTLVLHGAEDAVVDPGNAALLAERIPGARVELFSGCGHLFFWEQPERFADTVAEFLA
jgi:pimeloyl-ACP methyl ester carboxylesterase